MAGIYRLSVEDKDIFQEYVSDSDSIKGSNTIRQFYGPNDTIEIINRNAGYLKLVLEKNFNIFIENEIDNNLHFSVKIPNGKIKQTAKFLKENYGIRLTQEQAERDFLIVKSKK